MDLLRSPAVSKGVAATVSTAAGHAVRGVLGAWTVYWIAGWLLEGTARAVGATGLLLLWMTLTYRAQTATVRRLEEEERAKGIGSAGDVPAWMEQEARRLARRFGIAHPEVARLGGEEVGVMVLQGAEGRGVVVVTEGAVRMFDGGDPLTRREFAAVLAHELGHLRADHMRRTVVENMAMACAVLWTFELGGVWWAGAVAALAAAVQAHLSQRREVEADRLAAEYADPDALASALERMGRETGRLTDDASLEKAVFGSHPAIRDRIETLRALGRRLRQRRGAA